MSITLEDLIAQKNSRMLDLEPTFGTCTLDLCCRTLVVAHLERRIAERLEEAGRAADAVANWLSAAALFRDAGCPEASARTLGRAYHAAEGHPYKEVLQEAAREEMRKLKHGQDCGTMPAGEFRPTMVDGPVCTNAAAVARVDFKM